MDLICVDPGIASWHCKLRGWSMYQLSSYSKLNEFCNLLSPTSFLFHQLVEHVCGGKHFQGTTLLRPSMTVGFPTICYHHSRDGLLAQDYVVGTRGCIMLMLRLGEHTGRGEGHITPFSPE